MSKNPESDKSTEPAELADKALDIATGGVKVIVTMGPVTILPKPGAGTGSETHDPGLKNQSTKI